MQKIEITKPINKDELQKIMIEDGIIDDEILKDVESYTVKDNGYFTELFKEIFNENFQITIKYVVK